MKKYLVSLLALTILFAPAASSAEYIYYTNSAAAQAGVNPGLNTTTPVVTTTYTPVTTSTTNASRTLTCTILSVNLRQLDTDARTGGSVTKLQSFLYAKGYLSVAPTGYFGAMTRDAVTAFQNQYGLVPNPPAFVGPQTRAKIQEVSCGHSLATTNTTATSQQSATSCAPGDIFDIRTGLRCNSTQTNYNPPFTTTSTNTTNSTTNPLAAPIVLPYMRFLSIAPLTPVASTTRMVTVRWEAQTIPNLDLGLINNLSSEVSVLATSTANDGLEVLTLSNLIDGNYSFYIAWPENRVAHAVSPVNTVQVSSRIITINPYPTATTTPTTPVDSSYNQQAINDYVANTAETQKKVEEAKKKVNNADTAEEKQSALQELCSGFKFYINPIDCSLIKLTGI